MSFASYQQLIEQVPTGSISERTRKGNLLELEVTTQSLSHEALVLRVTTVDAGSRQRVFPADQDIVNLLTPQSQDERLFQRLWIPLPAESGVFAYLISLRTSDGVPLVLRKSQRFTVNPQGTAVRPNVVLVELRVRKTGRTSGTLSARPRASTAEVRALPSSPQVHALPFSAWPRRSPSSIVGSKVVVAEARVASSPARQPLW